ncbi:MAG: hypothetical protein KGK10_10600 [Rhodospirillales bacterium]|nr:hypothetical protein [Rhodospirillales bacterium]
MSENLAPPRPAPRPTGSGWPAHTTSVPGIAGHGVSKAASLGLSSPGWGQPPHRAAAETAILAAPEINDHAILAGSRGAALRLLAEEHVAVHGGALRPLAHPSQAWLIRTAREHAEGLDARLRLLLGEHAVASFDLPEQAEALSERLAGERHVTEPGFAVALDAPSRPWLRLVAPPAGEALDATLSQLDPLPAVPPPLLHLPLAALHDEAFLRFAARHRRRAGTDAPGLVATIPFAELLAAPDAARRAAAALAHAGHRLAAALPPQALRLFDPSTIAASLLVLPWDPAWQPGDASLRRAGPARVIATGVDGVAALSSCRAAGIGAVAGRMAARLLGIEGRTVESPAR